MRQIVRNLRKAELYEKALEIYNLMKDRFENTFYDFDSVGKILVHYIFI